MNIDFEKEGFAKIGNLLADLMESIKYDAKMRQNIQSILSALNDCYAKVLIVHTANEEKEEWTDGYPDKPGYYLAKRGTNHFLLVRLEEETYNAYAWVPPRIRDALINEFGEVPIDTSGFQWRPTPVICVMGRHPATKDVWGYIDKQEDSDRTDVLIEKAEELDRIFLAQERNTEGV